MIAKLSDICFSCLAKFSSSFSHSPLKIILKQIFPSGSVNIADYYSTITSFYHKRTRERAKYESVLHCNKAYCTVASRIKITH